MPCHACAYRVLPLHLAISEPTCQVNRARTRSLVGAPAGNAVTAGLIPRRRREAMKINDALSFGGERASERVHREYRDAQNAWYATAREPACLTRS